ncbi:MAG: carboxypeptidase-like regulatory domain-containing protein [Bryobacterales bacterium]|nr:carboxypeptidase-like regulatory domain-containing protein [Bryobacterales bacterium]
MFFRALRVGVPAILAAVAAGGQTFGEFTGAVIAGAKVTITSTATNVARETETNESGNYTVPFLSPGVYDLQAETDGFKSARQEDWTLQVGDVARVDFTLEIGVVT